jgi:hypothetical protein
MFAWSWLEELSVDGPKRHGVDDQLVTFGRDEHDEFEQIGGSVRTDDEPSGSSPRSSTKREWSTAWRMSASAMPWRRAEGWISTHEYCTTKYCVWRPLGVVDAHRRNAAPLAGYVRGIEPSGSVVLIARVR